MRRSCDTCGTKIFKPHPRRRFCTKCREAHDKVYHQQWNKDHRKDQTAYMRRWRAANPGVQAARKREAYRKSPKPKLVAYAWRAANRAYWLVLKRMHHWRKLLGGPRDAEAAAQLRRLEVRRRALRAPCESGRHKERHDQDRLQKNLYAMMPTPRARLEAMQREKDALLGEAANEAKERAERAKEIAEGVREQQELRARMKQLDAFHYEALLH